jgi:uncharacterized protein Yka (UPF0111/DUF47 family)
MLVELWQRLVHQDALCVLRWQWSEIASLRKNAVHLKARSKELHDLENQADDVYEMAIIHLFETETDGIELIKTKDILNELERATDAGERCRQEH